MHVCIYVFMWVCVDEYMHIYMHVYCVSLGAYVCIFNAYNCVCFYAWMRASSYACAKFYMHVFMIIRVHRCKVRTKICMYADTYVFIHTRTGSHACTGTCCPVRVYVCISGSWSVYMYACACVQFKSVLFCYLCFSVYMCIFKLLCCAVMFILLDCTWRSWIRDLSAAR
jgi:hypothetical protein